MSDPREHADAIVEMLYGDGAWEIVKALTAEEKRQKTQAKIGLASNVVGIAAGTAGLVAASRNPALRRAGAKLENAGPATGPILRKLKPSAKVTRRTIQAGAAGAVGLQGANLAGDAVANRVLARSASDKKPKIKKSFTPIPSDAKSKAIKAAANKGFAAAKVAPDKLKKVQAKVDEVKKSVDIIWSGEVAKADDEKRQVFGWASIVELDGKPVVDLQGDYMTPEMIEKAAYDYVQKSRKGGLQHRKSMFGDQGVYQVSELIESVVINKEKKAVLGLPDDSPTGWWIGFKVNDDEAWQDYKSGRRTAFSIHGTGVRKDVELVD